MAALSFEFDFNEQAFLDGFSFETTTDTRDIRAIE